MAYQIFTDSSSDLSTEDRKRLNVSYYRMGIVLNGEEMHADIDWQEYSPEQLYAWIRDSKNHIKTSLVSIQEINEKSEPFLKEGKDILYITCSTALSGTRNVFEMAKRDLLEKYPGRKIISVDSRRAELALGLIVMHACEKRDAGMSIEDLAKWVEENRQFYQQVGSVGSLKYLRAAGRVSGPAAFFGDVIGLKPIITWDIKGGNYALKKVRGALKSYEESFDYLKETMVPGVTDIVYIGKAGREATPAAEYLRKRIEEELHLKVEEFWIGPIVGISCGPGMFGCWYRGKEVTITGE